MQSIGAVNPQRRLALFGAFSSLDFILGFFPLASFMLGYLMLPMMRILLGWRMTLIWLMEGIFLSIPNIASQSAAVAGTATSASNPTGPITSIHLPQLWVPYLSPFIVQLQFLSGLIPVEAKLAALSLGLILIYRRYWKIAIRDAKRTLIQIPQIRAWGYFDEADFQDYERYKARRDYLKTLHGFARIRAALKR